MILEASEMSNTHFGHHEPSLLFKLAPAILFCIFFGISEPHENKNRKTNNTDNNFIQNAPDSDNHPSDARVGIGMGWGGVFFGNSFQTFFESSESCSNVS